MDETASADVDSARPRAPARLAARKLVKWGIAAVILLAAIVGGIVYWNESKRAVSTENAYVNANRIDIAPQVAGPIVAVQVRDQQHVDKGDLLVEIDARPYKIAVDAAQAQLEIAYQTTSGESAAVAAARAQVSQRQAELRNAQSNERRVRDLIERKLISQQSADAMITQAETSQAAVHAAEANLEQAQSALGEAGKRNASVRAAVAKLDQAQARFCSTRASLRRPAAWPRDFGLATRQHRAGQGSSPCSQIISDEEYSVRGPTSRRPSFDRIRPGQQATIRTRLYRDREFPRRRRRFEREAAGARLSLLPAQNATGNWVKVTQRVPVRDPGGQRPGTPSIRCASARPRQCAYAVN